MSPLRQPGHERRATQVACAHCRLPVPTQLYDAGCETQYCCAGCRTVAAAIRGAGLERYYELAADAAVVSGPARVSGRAYAAYDDPGFDELYVRHDAPDRASVELALEGMHCAACVWLVERLVAVEPGVVEARVDLGRRRVRLSWDPRHVELSRLACRLDSLGYPSEPYREDRRGALRRREERRALTRVGVAGAIAGNVMLIAFALYGGMFNGMAPEYERYFRVWALGLTLIALVWPGRVFFRGAFSSLRAGMLHMDVPVALALALGTARGAFATWRGGGEVYFESLTAVVFLLLAGRWFQSRRQGAAEEAVEGLFRLTPTAARRVTARSETAEEIVDVAVETLAAGDIVDVRAGESFPADGEIVEGRTAVDRALLSGESSAVAAGVGDAVHAGTINVDATVRVRVESTGRQTQVGRLVALVERLANDRPPIVRLADRVAHGFVVTVLAAAGAVTAVWWVHDPAVAVERAIALLIVTCPCALGLATPLAIVAAVGRAARRGILIKGGQTLEHLDRPGVVVLDKTGTLTLGRLEVVRRTLAPGTGDEALRAIVAAESGVAHPIAAALCRALAEVGPRPVATDARRIPGSGVEARVDGRLVRVGSPAWVDRGGESLPDWAGAAVAEIVGDSLTPVVATVGGEVAVVFGLGDSLEPDAAESVTRLRRAGWSVRVLSGDHPEVVRRIAAQVGIEPDACEGGASPERKVAAVREVGAAGSTVVMVGDGVNDAAAMTAAHVGVAVHGGAEPSLAASDVYMRRPGLTPLVELVTGARRAVGVIRRNIGISLAYNLLAGALAAVGAIDPLIAAVLMPLSSLSVLTLSYRSRTFDGL